MCLLNTTSQDQYIFLDVSLSYHIFPEHESGIWVFTEWKSVKQTVNYYHRPCFISGRLATHFMLKQITLTGDCRKGHHLQHLQNEWEQHAPIIFPKQSKPICSYSHGLPQLEDVESKLTGTFLWNRALLLNNISEGTLEIIGTHPGMHAELLPFPTSAWGSWCISYTKELEGWLLDWEKHVTITQWWVPTSPIHLGKANVAAPRSYWFLIEYVIVPDTERAVSLWMAAYTCVNPSSGLVHVTTHSSQTSFSNHQQYLSRI